MGRPSKPPGEALSERLDLDARPVDLGLWKRAAELEGKPLRVWARGALNARALAVLLEKEGGDRGDGE